MEGREGDVRAAASGEVTQLLSALDRGDESVRGRIHELLYAELRKIAASILRDRRRGTLQTGDLVGEAYLRLVNQRVTPTNSGHFLRIAALAMRRTLVDYFRKKHRDKRAGDRQRVDLPADLPSVGDDPVDLVAADEIVGDLERMDERLGAVATMIFFAGMTEAEAARALGLTQPKVHDYWIAARALLSERLRRRVS